MLILIIRESRFWLNDEKKNEKNEKIIFLSNTNFSQNINYKMIKIKKLIQKSIQSSRFYFYLWKTDIFVVKSNFDYSRSQFQFRFHCFFFHIARIISINMFISMFVTFCFHLFLWRIILLKLIVFFMFNHRIFKSISLKRVVVFLLFQNKLSQWTSKKN